MNKQKLLDLFERVANTWWQSALMFIVTSSTLDVSVLGAAALAGLPAAVNLLYRAVVGVKVATTNVWLDLTSRSAITFGATFLGLLGGGAFDFTDASAWSMAAISAGTAALAVLKGGIASILVPGTITPASLVPVPVKAG